MSGARPIAVDYGGRAAHQSTSPTSAIARFGERPTLAERVEKLEATAVRQSEQIADLTSCDEGLRSPSTAAERAAIKPRFDEPPMLGRARDRDGPLEYPHKKAATVADADVLADLLATVIELKDDQAELREIDCQSQQTDFPKATTKPAACRLGDTETGRRLDRLFSRTNSAMGGGGQKTGARLGGRWIVKLDRLPKRDAERN